MSMAKTMFSCGFTLCRDNCKQKDSRFVYIYAVYVHVHARAHAHAYLYANPSALKEQHLTFMEGVLSMKSASSQGIDMEMGNCTHLVSSRWNSRYQRCAISLHCRRVLW